MADEDHKKSDGGHGGGKHGGHGGGHGGGGGHEEHEGAPEWLISFADNVMLQMGFFVILLAMNMKPAATGGGGGDEKGGEPNAHMLDMVLAIREAFNNPISLNDNDPALAPLVRRLRERNDVGRSPELAPDGFHPDVEIVRKSDYFGHGGLVHFERDSAATGGEDSAIETIATQLKGLGTIIQVRGHVSAAESYGSANHGIDLAHRRAVAVAEELVRRGIAWERLRVVACGDSEPLIRPAYNDEAHRANQRVEVVSTSDSTTDYERGEATPERQLPASSAPSVPPH